MALVTNTDAPWNQEFADHVQTYRTFVRCAFIFAAHVMMRRALVALLLLAVLGAARIFAPSARRSRSSTSTARCRPMAIGWTTLITVVCGAPPGCPTTGGPTHAAGGSTPAIMVGYGCPTSLMAGSSITMATGCGPTATGGFGSPATIGLPLGSSGATALGWEPMPPEPYWQGAYYYGSYDCTSPAYYSHAVFVSETYFGRPGMASHYEPRSRNATIAASASVNVTSYIRGSAGVNNRGVDIRRLEAATGQPISVLPVVQSKAAITGGLGANMKEVRVFRPKVAGLPAPKLDVPSTAKSLSQQPDIPPPVAKPLDSRDTGSIFGPVGRSPDDDLQNSRERDVSDKSAKVEARTIASTRRSEMSGVHFLYSCNAAGPPLSCTSAAAAMKS